MPSPRDQETKINPNPLYVYTRRSKEVSPTSFPVDYVQLLILIHPIPLLYQLILHFLLLRWIPLFSDLDLSIALRKGK